MSKELKNLDEKEVELVSGGKSDDQKLKQKDISIYCHRQNEHTSKCIRCKKEYSVSYGDAEVPHDIRKETYCPECRYKALYVK